LKPEPPGPLEGRLLGAGELPPGLPAHGVDGAVEVLDDVEAIEDELGVGETGLDGLDVRVPHVAADDPHAAPPAAAQPAEEGVDGVAGASFAAHTRRWRSRS